MHCVNPTPEPEPVGQGCGAEALGEQKYVAGQRVDTPPTQNEPEGQVDAKPLRHTFVPGHAMHSQPPMGLDGLVDSSRPGTQTHALPDSVALFGHMH